MKLRRNHFAATWRTKNSYVEIWHFPRGYRVGDQRLEIQRLGVRDQKLEMCVPVDDLLTEGKAQFGKFVYQRSEVVKAYMPIQIY